MATHTYPLSAQEKNKLLTARERRWETLDAEHVRTFKIAGPAGVYELQEGIFLMCDEYSDTDDGRVSQQHRSISCFRAAFGRRLTRYI